MTKLGIILYSSLFALSGCITTTSHYGTRPDLSKLQIGMSQEEVINILGKPVNVAASEGVTYLQYGWDSPWDGRVGATEEYFVRLVNGKVNAFGEKGDFDSTKDPTLVIKHQE